jgi:hypothetical protein
MPLYYFHIRYGHEVEEDPEGTELPNPAAAQAEAVRMARELSGEMAELGRDAVIEVADGVGQTVLLVPLSAGTGPIH